MAIAAPERPVKLNVAGQDVGPKDAPLPSLFPQEPGPPKAVRDLTASGSMMGLQSSLRASCAL